MKLLDASDLDHQTDTCRGPYGDDDYLGGDDEDDDDDEIVLSSNRHLLSGAHRVMMRHMAQELPSCF